MNRLSVIVVSFSAPEVLERCLQSLRKQDAEIVVVRSDQEEVGVPQLRSLGFARSHGEIVALLEDDCVAPPDWCANLLRAHEHPAIAIGGAIEPGDYRRAGDWATYFCEYGRFMPPLPDGEAATLPGTNVSYKRAALPATGDAFYEAFVHPMIRPLRADARLVVRQYNAQPFRRVLVSRYHHGRSYAALRVKGRSRWPYLGIPLVLPAVMVWRILRTVFARGRYVGAALRALPWIAVLCVVWSFGEFMGYAAGAGRSAGEWK